MYCSLTILSSIQRVQISNLNDGKNYIVTGGLGKPGDKIVVEGVQNLQDGQKITPITLAEKEAKFRKL